MGPPGTERSQKGRKEESSAGKEEARWTLRSKDEEDTFKKGRLNDMGSFVIRTI